MLLIRAPIFVEGLLLEEAVERFLGTPGAVGERLRGIEACLPEWQRPQGDPPNETCTRLGLPP